MLANRMMMAASAGGGEQNFYKDLQDAGLASNVVFCLDAGSISSYDGVDTQTWADISGNGNDFHFGAGSGSSSDDPTFNGTAGDLSSSEYMSTDGGDHFAIKSIPSGLVDLHQNGAVWSYAMWLYITTGGEQTFFGSIDGEGVSEGLNSSSQRRINAEKSTAGYNEFDADASIATGAWLFHGGAIDENGGASAGRMHLNGAYDQRGSSDQWDPSYTDPGTTDSTDFKIMDGGPVTQMKSGGRIAGLTIWNGTALTEANFETIWNAQKGRFGL